MIEEFDEDVIEMISYVHVALHILYHQHMHRTCRQQRRAAQQPRQQRCRGSVIVMAVRSLAPVVSCGPMRNLPERAQAGASPLKGRPPDRVTPDLYVR